MRALIAAVFACSLAAPASAQLAPFDANGLTYGHVHLNVKDPEVHKKLWVDHFGGVVVEKGPLIAVRLPNMLVALTKRDPTGPSMGTVMDHFGFKVKDLAAFLAKWRAAGYQVTQEFKGAEGFPNAYLSGPDDIRIELRKTRPGSGGLRCHILSDPRRLLDWYRHLLAAEAEARHHRDDRRCLG
jgi:hypothetical protein